MVEESEISQKPWYQIWWVWFTIGSVIAASTFITPILDEIRMNRSVKAVFSDYQHVASITISGFSHSGDYRAAQELVDAKVGWVFGQQVNRSTTKPIGPVMSLEEDEFTSTFGFNDNFNIQSFADHVLETPLVIFRDTEGSKIFESTDIVNAYEDWYGLADSYVLTIILHKDVMSELQDRIGKSGDGLQTYIEFEGSTQSDLYTLDIGEAHGVVVKPIDWNTMVDFHSLAILLQQPKAPRKAAVTLEIN